MSQNVKIVFTASKSKFGRVIRWLTGSAVSHVYLEFDVWGRRMAMESTVGGTRLVPASKARHHVVREFHLSSGSREPLLQMMGYLGTEYDYTGVMLIAWIKMAWRWFGLKLGAPTWSSKALKCSELLIHFLKIISPNSVELRILNIEMIVPEHILGFCEDNGGLFDEVTGDVSA